MQHFMTYQIPFALTISALLGYASAVQAADVPLSGAISYMSVADTSGPYVNPVSNAFGSLSESGTDGSTGSVTFSGFSVSPTLTANADTTAISSSSGTTYYQYYAEIVADPGVLSATTVGLDVFASGSASTTTTDVYASDGTPVAAGAAAAIFSINQSPVNLGSWTAVASQDTQLSQSFSVDDSGATALPAEVGSPLQIFFEAEAGAQGGEISSAFLDPVISIDPAYANDYSLIFGPGVSPDVTSSAPDTSGTVAMLAVGLLVVAILRPRIRSA
jgi:hypothetical protein